MTQTEYDAEIRSIAQDAIDEAKGNRTDAEETIWETVDSHQWVIYDAYHEDVIKFSSNEDYGFDNGLIDANAAIKEGGLSQLHQQVAFCAMQADVMDALRNVEYEEPEVQEVELPDGGVLELDTDDVTIRYREPKEESAESN